MAHHPLLPTTDASALAEALGQRCEGAYAAPDGWWARCPAHDDQDPSLHITPTTDRVLLHCFAGCRTEDVLQALGLTIAQTFVARTAPQTGLGQIVQIYDYVNAEGRLVHQTVRYAPKNFRQRHPNPAKPGGVEWNLRHIDLVLYHLPDVLQAVREGVPIYLTEGEKDAETLRAEGLVATCNAMGAGKWRGSYTQTLRGAHVILLPHFDEAGWKHAAMIADALIGAAASIKIVSALHTDQVGSDLSDWVQAGGTREEFDALVEHAAYYTPAVPPDIQDPVPLGWSPTGTPPPPVPASPPPARTLDTPGRLIEQHRHLLPQVVAQAEAALRAMPGAPLVFQRARRLVAIGPPEQVAQGIARAPGTPIINALTATQLRALLAQAAGWLTPMLVHTKAPKLVPDMPAGWVVETLLEQDAWAFPPLTGLINSPTLRPDGSLMLTPGYDAHTGLWLAWQETSFPAMAEHPTREDAQTALAMLYEPFQDFPFAEPYHCSAAIAAVLTLIARYAVESVPLFAIRATTRGSGKTLLADCIAMIATGRLAPKMPQVPEEEEERKRLLALALDGDPLVVIDNVSGALGNPALDLAVTSQIYKDRLLGKNTTKEAPLHTVFLATGNNMQFKGDMARRAIPIDLAPMIEHPETRSGFTYPRLLAWIQHERPRLISAALTLLRAYIVAGKPTQPIAPYGSFELWSDLIRSALVWVEAPDPCKGREGLEAASDETFEAHAELLEAWYACYGKGPITLAGMIGELQWRCTTPGPTVNDFHNVTAIEKPWNTLRDALGFFDGKYDGQRLNAKSIAKGLKRLCGRVINGKLLKQLSNKSKNGMQWVVQETPIAYTSSGFRPIFGDIGDIGDIGDYLAGAHAPKESRETSYARKTSYAHREGGQGTTMSSTSPMSPVDDPMSDPMRSLGETDEGDEIDPFDDQSDVPF